MRYPITQEGMIGSCRRADVRLRHSSVRRRHIYFDMQENGLKVRTHATARLWVNGREVRDALLKDGDMLRIGGVKLLLVLMNASGPMREAPAARDAIFETDSAQPAVNPAYAPRHQEYPVPQGYLRGDENLPGRNMRANDVFYDADVPSGEMFHERNVRTNDAFPGKNARASESASGRNIFHAGYADRTQADDGFENTASSHQAGDDGWDESGRVWQNPEIQPWEMDLIADIPEDESDWDDDLLHAAQDDWNAGDLFSVADDASSREKSGGARSRSPRDEW